MIIMFPIVPLDGIIVLHSQNQWLSKESCVPNKEFKAVLLIML